MFVGILVGEFDCVCILWWYIGFPVGVYIIVNPVWGCIVTYGVRWSSYNGVYVCMVDRKGVLFMVDYDDGCGVLVFMGCNLGPVD